MTSTTFVGNDGWTRDDGYIEAAPENAAGHRLYDALSFSYRPATRPEWITLDSKVDKIRKMGGDEVDMKVEMAGCQFVAEHVKSWDLKNQGIHPVELSAANLMYLHPILFNRLYRIVRCLDAPDAKPSAPTPPSDAEMLGN